MLLKLLQTNISINFRRFIKMSTEISEVSSNKMFDGVQKIISHNSKVLDCSMNVAVYLPPQAESEQLPVLYWLSGLTCNETNFIQKSGVQKYLAKEGIILVCPDTSPRGPNIPDESNSWDFGIGAGFYINATQQPWRKNYQMFTYITTELIQLINANFPIIEGKQSIFGHSMGGHGALICALKNPGLYKSVSAFAPICNPINCPWGNKAFSGYLGNRETGNWEQWDSTELVKTYNGPPLELFIEQGTNDQFASQLLPENLITACKNSRKPALLKMRDGYDHSYYYIATFIEEHIKYHSQHLKN